mgnify:CR=1 FL=1
MLAPDAHPLLPAGLIACHECDLLQREPALAPGETARCARCGAFLARNPPDSLDRTLALTCTAAVLYVLANIYPLVGLEMQGRQVQVTLASALRILWQDGMAPVAALVDDRIDIVADFREKSLRHTAVNTDAAVVFDALPGQVFPAHVTSSDAGILAGQEAVNGQLSQPEQSTRWVRDAQRMRIHVALDQPLAKPLPTGARATVQLYNSEGPFARTFAGLQIHLVSWLHYVY